MDVTDGKNFCNEAINNDAPGIDVTDSKAIDNETAGKKTNETAGKETNETAGKETNETAGKETNDAIVMGTDGRSEIVGRLKHIMSLRHLSQRGFARLLKLDPSNLSKVLTGKLPFTEGLINRIVVDLGVSKPWLKTGAGLPFEKGPVARDITLQDGGRGAIEPGGGVPVYDVDVTAGCGSLETVFSETRPVGTMNIPELPAGAYVVKVRGDSMSPRISNGGYVAIRQIRDPRNIFWGQMYVVQLEEYRMVKYVRRHSDPSMVILHSDNPAYDDMDVPRKDICALYIVEAVLNYEVY